MTSTDAMNRGHRLTDSPKSCTENGRRYIVCLRRKDHAMIDIEVCKAKCRKKCKAYKEATA